MNHLSQVPEYTNYLTYIFTHFPAKEFASAPIAGIIIKNELNDHRDEIPRASLEYIQSVIFGALRSEEEIVRRTAGLVVVALITISLEGPEVTWPQGLMELMNMMSSSNIVEMEVSRELKEYSKLWLTIAPETGRIQHLC